MPTLRALVTKALLPTGEGQQWALPPPRVLHSCDQAEPGAKQPSQAGPQPLGDTLCLQRFGWRGFAHSGVHSTESHPGGKFSTAAPCLCSSRGREVTPTQKYLKRILISHFIWIRICANFDGLNVTRPNFNCNQRALSDKSGCFIALFK